MKKLIAVALCLAALFVVQRPALSDTISVTTFTDINGTLLEDLDPSIGAAGVYSESETNAVSVWKNYLVPDHILMNVTVTENGTYTFTEEISNNTGFTWSDFNWELLSDSSSAILGFGTLEDNGGLSPDPVNGPFITDRYLKLYGTIGDQSTFTVKFTVNVTGLAQGESLNFVVDQYDSFVPTPSALIGMIGIACCGLGLTIVRRRRSR